MRREVSSPAHTFCGIAQQTSKRLLPAPRRARIDRASPSIDLAQPVTVIRP